MRPSRPLTRSSTVANGAPAREPPLSGKCGTGGMRPLVPVAASLRDNGMRDRHISLIVKKAGRTAYDVGLLASGTNRGSAFQTVRSLRRSPIIAPLSNFICSKLGAARNALSIRACLDLSPVAPSMLRHLSGIGSFRFPLHLSSIVQRPHDRNWAAPADSFWSEVMECGSIIRFTDLLAKRRFSGAVTNTVGMPSSA